MESFLAALGALFIITFIILYFWSIIWSYKDAASRGKNGLAVAILIALFVWPFGLLFWTIIRPEDKKIEEKAVETKKSTSEPNKYMSDFKEMPFLIKLLLVVSLYSLVATLLDFIQMKPIDFGYFDSSFPRNYPIIWHLYSFVFTAITIVVFFKRSYSILKKYLYVSMGVLIIPLLNFIYLFAKLPAEQKMAFVLVIVIPTYLFTGLIFTYLLRQKKYFNKT